MGRIKQGLDYFPLNTDFMHDRIVRRVMKREGDSAFTVLLYTLSYLYSGEGYYIRASDDFYDELSDQLFDTDNDTVRRTILLFVEYGFFDAALYERYAILTSADIQRQFLFVTKRRNRPSILSDYRLVEEMEPKEAGGERTKQPSSAEQPLSAARNAVVAKTSPVVRNGTVQNLFSNGNDVAETPDDVTETMGNVTESPVSVTKTAHIKRKEKERIENILPNPPFQGGGEEGEGGYFGEIGTEGGGGGGRSAVASMDSSERKLAVAFPGRKPAKKKRELTQEDIDCLQVPADGLPRNFSGLVDNLRLYRVPPVEQYAIVLKSNYGAIGGKVWQGFSAIRGSGGKIKLPGHYLLSVLDK